MTTPPNAPDHGCSCGRPDCQYDKAWGNPLRETPSAPDDKPNAPEVDVLARMCTQAAQYRVDSGNFTQSELIAQTQQDRTAVAALLTREAALVADVAGLREDIADRKRVIECKNIDIRERDASLHGWAERAKKAEAERDALAAEVGALRLDAERLEHLESMFAQGVHVEGCYSGTVDGGNIKRCATVFIGSKEWRGSSIREVIDAARAEAGHGLPAVD